MELTNSPICIPVHRESSNQSTIFLTNARLTLVAVGLYSIFTVVPAGEARGASRHFHPKYKVPESTRFRQSVRPVIVGNSTIVNTLKLITELDESFPTRATSGQSVRPVIVSQCVQLLLETARSVTPIKCITELDESFPTRATSARSVTPLKRITELDDSFTNSSYFRSVTRFVNTEMFITELDDSFTNSSYFRSEPARFVTPTNFITELDDSFPTRANSGQSVRPVISVTRRIRGALIGTQVIFTCYKWGVGVYNTCLCCNQEPVARAKLHLVRDSEYVGLSSELK
ncbi:hypothetical protein J6590_049258 [Homalodisca vitripennis]|nr:hypothetical protein J6590_049258 [Homalodisca vitripennis]